MKALMWPSLVRLAIGLVSASLALVAATSATTAQVVPPPPLTDEGLNAVDAGVLQFGTLEITADCHARGGRATISYTASGPAVGPYPGTYTETGTAILGPVISPTVLRPVVSFKAQFTIASATGDVTGTKHLASTIDATCQQDLGAKAHVFTTYTAEITTATGTCTTKGTADTEVREVFPPETEFHVQEFHEPFLSGKPCTAPCPPREDRDNDGLIDSQENLLLTALDDSDSDNDGILDGNDDANGNGVADEDEDDGGQCPDEDSDGDGVDNEDEDD